MRLSGVDIKHATNGSWHGALPEVITSVVTDTRNFAAGDTFLALRGPNFDGHHFAAAIADRAVALIGDAEGLKLWHDLDNSKLEVDDTLQALGDIAHAWRNRLTETTVIAITGSFGKTSLRSILEHGFTALGVKISATRANLNNLIGVPQTLLAVSLDADVAVIECGISERGEMTRLAAMVQPDIAILTGMTVAHAQGLGGLAGVVREKSLLLAQLNEGGWCALGAGVSSLLDDNSICKPSHHLSMDDESGSDVVAWQLVGRELLMCWQGQEAAMTLALPAQHWAANIAFAASIMLRYLNNSRTTGLAEVVAALSDWQPPAGRMKQCEGVHGSLVLDDCYNANPVSMQAAIDTLHALDGRRIAVLGDMAELGEGSDAAHAAINIDGLDRVYLIGSAMRLLAEKHPQARWFATTADALQGLASESFTAGDTVLVKASRSMALESIVKLLCRQEVAHAL